ncbi:MAG TPA: hypothetical protein VJ914_22130 [Pseudonocardiaceae bacterium]|nr:hypothetical protein [Pseudonocardiaceae bacterium]
MRSVRIAAAAGIVATGLALGAAGIASAATPTAAAPAPAQAKSAPAKPAAKPAPLHVVKAASARSRAIVSAERAAKTAHVTRANYVVTASHLNVRTGPGTKFRVAGTLAKGAHVVASAKTVNGFRQLANGHWVSAHYLKALR